MSKNFNLIMAGFGGQGLITLIEVAAVAAFEDGHDVKSSELHGLSQRGGSVATFLRFGKKVYSPLFERNKADLVIGLELLETLRACEFAGPETKIVANDNFSPFVGIMPKTEIFENFKKIGGDNFFLVEASKICAEKLGKEVLAGMYLLGYAVAKGFLPIRKEAVLRAINRVIPEKYRDMNINAFKLAENS